MVEKMVEKGGKEKRIGRKKARKKMQPRESTTYHQLRGFFFFFFFLYREFELPFFPHLPIMCATFRRGGGGEGLLSPV